LEAIRDDKSVAQIAVENSTRSDPNQIHKWKRQALKDFAKLFEDDRNGKKIKSLPFWKVSMMSFGFASTSFSRLSS